MKLRLRSDFRDYYDGAFDNAYGTMFERLTRNGMDRWSMMQTLEGMGFSVPKWGTVRSIVNPSDTETEWVVHYDPLAHRGEAKVVMRGSEALTCGPDCFATRYDSASRGATKRLLVVGGRRFGMRYHSRDDWRSNFGDVVIDEVHESTGPEKYGPYPLYAIDFLINGQAIDLNTAPGISGTGVEDLIGPKEVVEEIKCWYRHVEEV